MMTNNYLEQIFDYFDKYNVDLYLVGGGVRDFLLNKEFDDYDFATPFNTKELIDLLDIVDYDHFSLKFGTLKTELLGHEVEITSFREESEYKDHRRPTNIKFVKDIKKDAARRDFTINALYLDSSFKVIDFYDGISDLKNGIIRMIGDPYKRLKEDPVRILRAIRFSKNLNFKIEENLLDAINKNINELNFISSNRLDKELAKFHNPQDYYDFISDRL